MAERRAPIRVVQGVAGLERDDERLLFAVGVFDGLHRGHRYLLARLRAAAADRGARPAVITFDAHPDAVILGHAPALLLDPEERLGRLARAGVAVAVVQHFDEALRRTAYDDFVATVAERTRLAGFLMTPEAAVGHERRGTPAALASLGERLGYDVVVVPPYQLDGGPVRSERIRAAIAEGDLHEAERLLGRAVSVTGRTDGPGSGVVRFPVPVALPPDGTYEVTVGRPWSRRSPGRPLPGARVAATVGEGVVRVGDLALPRGGGVRVRFDAGARPAR
jgi:riboflavin kinase/FMN adenylyltransferase